MTKRILFSAIFLLLIVSVYGHHQEKTILQQIATTNDTLVLKKYLAYADTLFGIDNKTTTELYKAIADRSEQIHYDYGAGDALVNLGELNLINGNYSEGISLAKIALNFFNKTNNQYKIAYCFYIIGKSHHFMGNKDSAMRYLLEGEKKLGDKPSIDLAQIYNAIGHVLRNSYSRDDFSRSATYHQKAIDISKRFNDTSGLIYGLATIADTYVVLKDTNKAYSNIYEALKLLRFIKDPGILGGTYTYVSNVYYRLGKRDSAILVGKTALQYTRSTGDLYDFLLATLSLARSYNLLNEQPKRLKILKEGMEMIEKKSNQSLWFGDFCEDIADASFKLGNYKDAYIYYKKYLDYNDSVDILKSNVQISDLDIKYQTVQKEKELSDQRFQLAKQDLQLQKDRTYVYLSLSSLILVLLLAGLLYLRHIYNKREHTRQLQAIKQEKEIHFLEALMQGEEKERGRIAKDLHDGVAGMLVAAKLHLNALVEQNSCITQSKELTRILNLLDETYTEVRKTSHNLMPEVLLKHGLDEAIRRYCCNVSSSQKLVIQYDSWGEFGRYKNSFELSIYRIVQELISNIIKHSKATKALVQMSLQKNLLSIAIEDNGIGLSEGISDGMGLHNLESKVLAMDGKVEIISPKGRGVCIYMEFDITQNKS